jgi:hypothetical protein
MDPIPSARSIRISTTGSSVTAWCTASASATARRSGTATAGCAPHRHRKPWGSVSRDGHFGFYSIGANTNVIGHAGKTLALIEAGIACYELTDELDTVGVYDFDGTLTGGYTAHPKRDPKTRELHAVSYTPYAGNEVQYSVIDTDGRARRTVDITVGGSLEHEVFLGHRKVMHHRTTGRSPSTSR